jgi:hypothetical protein
MSVSERLATEQPAVLMLTTMGIVFVAAVVIVYLDRDEAK